MSDKDSASWPENPLGYKVAFEEMQLALQNNLASFDALRNMARTLFGAASLIVGLLGTLQIISSEIVPGYRGLYNVLIALILLGYLALIICCLWILKPVNVQLPTKVDWDTLWNFYISETDVNIMKTRVSSYIQAIELNWPILTKMRTVTNLATFILAGIIVLILAISLLPRA